MGIFPVSLSRHLYELTRPFAFQHYLENQGRALAMPALNDAWRLTLILLLDS